VIQATSDPWLAQVMSRPAYRISGLLAPAEADQLGAALAIATAGPAFAYARVPTHEVFTVQALESAGFRVVDSGVTFEMKSPAIQPDAKAPVRFAERRDEGDVSRLARNAFKYSRFHLDPLVPRELADEIKAQWAANYFQGKRGDFMVVAERAGEIAGFLQLLKASSDVLVIDLIAVAEKHRGHGLATQMIRFAVSACGSFARLQVGTQAANIDSLQFYQRFGFGILATSYVLHRHGS
jgi:GNAT superfamily N-acetyltransferase